MQQVFILLCVCVIGYLCKKINLLRDADKIVIKKIVFNLCLPSLLFYALVTSEHLSISLLKIVVGVLILQVIGFLIFQKVPAKYKEIVFVGSMGNTAFMGYPVTESLYPTHMLTAIAYDQTTILSGVTLWHYRGLKTLLNPPLVAVGLGLICKFTYTPQYLLEIAKIFKQATSALAMLYIGLFFNWKFDRLALIGAAIKLILFPFLSWLLTAYIYPFLGLSLATEDLKVFILQSSMPGMVATAILGVDMKLNVERISQIIILSTALFPLSLYAFRLAGLL